MIDDWTLFPGGLISNSIEDATMTAMKYVCGLLAASLLALLTLGNAAVAHQFSRQVVTMILNYTAGGPTDIEARIVARHLPKYLQGVKNIIVRNAGGGGGGAPRGVRETGERRGVNQ